MELLAGSHKKHNPWTVFQDRKNAQEKKKPLKNYNDVIKNRPTRRNTNTFERIKN